MIGRSLSHFRITEKLGAGGMGEVYRAEDEKLGRAVAIKVLPESFVANPERLGRFQREARVLASLNHPNIAAIHEVGEEEGTHFLVMELVPGETLASRLGRRSVSFEESLDIARQVAEALEEAHAKGVIHRDLKPENLKVTEEGNAAPGRVKVLDFGLAKAMEVTDSQAASASVLDQSPTLSMQATMQGVILGTAPYMSPEQAKGMTVDRQADIWAFGVVLYEMLTGERCFSGDSVPDTLAAVLRSEVDFNRLPASTPQEIRRLLRRCLERDRRRRLHDIGDARVVLEEVLEGRSSGSADTEAAAVRTRRPPSWKAVLPWLLAGTALTVAIVSRSSAPRSAGPASGEPQPSTAVSVRLPEGFVLTGDDAPVMDLSRDGRTLVFVGSGDSGRQLFLRRLDRVGVEAVPGTEEAQAPFLSPDGQWIGFDGGNEIRKVPLAGGTPATVTAVPAFRGAAWVAGGWIVYAPSYASALYKVREAGGASEPVTQLDAEAKERTHRWPAAVAGTPWVLFTVGAPDSPALYDQARIDAVRLDNGERKRVYEGAWMARFAPPDTLLLQRRSSVVALSFDPVRAEVTGDEQTVLSGVGGEATSGAGYFAVGAEVLAHVPAEAISTEKVLTLVSPGGREEHLEMPYRSYWFPRFSPDGNRLAVVIGSGQATDDDVWLYDLKAQRLSRLTFNPPNLTPVWSPDGRWVAFAGASGPRAATLFRKRADGVGEEEKIWTGKEIVLASDWSADGSRIAVTSTTFDEADSLAVDPETGAAQELAGGAGTQWGAVFSPDGAYVAYTTTETGIDEVFATTVGGAGGKWQVSSDGGRAPAWSRDGRYLYYARGSAIWQVDVETRGAFSAETPREVVRGPYLQGTNPVRNFDVGPDGRLVLVRPRTDVQRQKGLEILVGWRGQAKE